MSTAEIYEVVAANQDRFPIAALCRRLDVSQSGYHEWRERVPSVRAQANAELLERIRAVHAESDATYGMPRVRADLAEQGISASAKRIARLMRGAGLRGVCRRRGFTVTTRRASHARAAPDLVDRHFAADGPDRLWVADMTYVPTWAGFVYLAVVLDVFSRRVVGWSVGETMETALVIEALDRALAQRRPASVIHHSDSENGRAGCLGRSDPHSDRPRCQSPDLSAVREQPVEALSSADIVT